MRAGNPEVACKRKLQAAAECLAGKSRCNGLPAAFNGLENLRHTWLCRSVVHFAHVCAAAKIVAGTANYNCIDVSVGAKHPDRIQQTRPDVLRQNINWRVINFDDPSSILMTKAIPSEPCFPESRCALCRYAQHWAMHRSSALARLVNSVFGKWRSCALRSPFFRSQLYSMLIGGGISDEIRAATLDPGFRSSSGYMHVGKGDEADPFLIAMSMLRPHAMSASGLRRLAELRYASCPRAQQR